MKNEIKKEKLSNKETLSFWKSFDYSIYWLNVLITNYEISKAQAGYIINKAGI